MLRTAYVAGAALLGALALTGCSSDDDDHLPIGGGEHTTSAPDTKSGGASDQSGGSLDGVYKAASGGDSVTLTIKSGALVVIGETVCTGKVEERADPPTVTGTCAGGSNPEKLSGTIEANGSSLTFDWANSGPETFTKTGKAPDLSDLPTNVPTDLPTGLPDTSDIPDLSELGG